MYVLEQSAACRRALGEHEEAVEVYEHSVYGLSPPFPSSRVLSVIAVDPSNSDAKMKLAEVYEIMNEPRKALDLVYQGTSHPPSA
jgi:general transcription factor 3C polypeptide 3 (transcription factor C subunit 4)